METFWSGYFGIFDAKELKFSFYGSGDEIWESTTYETAAEYVSAVALDQNAVGMQHCEFTPGPHFPLRLISGMTQSN